MLHAIWLLSGAHHGIPAIRGSPPHDAVSLAQDFRGGGRARVRVEVRVRVRVQVTVRGTVEE